MTCRWIAAFAVFCCSLSASFANESLPEAQRALFLEFAADVSSEEADVMRIARQLVETPPTTLETIGFYGMADAPPAERALRGIISLLDARGHLISIEDKYVYELPAVLTQRGNLTGVALGSDLDVLGFFADVDPETGPAPEDWQAFRSWFPDHVQALDVGVAATGHALLSLTLPLGDTLYFWAPTPEVAARWRGRALYIGADSLQHNQELLVTMAVSAPDWRSYWDFMTYAMQMPEPYRPVPDGLK